MSATAHADEREVETIQKLFLGGPGDRVDERLRGALQTGVVARLPDELAGMIVPLTARRQVVGTMSIGEPLGRRHTPEEIIIAEDLGRRAGLALDNARLYQERDAVAVALQKGLLPASLPQAEGIEFGARYLPAGNGNEVGGDFYDVLPLGDDQWLLAIGDVCGKGPQAASITGLVRDVIRVLVREGRPLPYVMNALNTALLDQPDRARFCTVAAAIVQRDGDSVRVQLCLAGHLLPALIRARRRRRAGRQHRHRRGHLRPRRRRVRRIWRSAPARRWSSTRTESPNGGRRPVLRRGQPARVLSRSHGLDAAELAEHVQRAAEDFTAARCATTWQCWCFAGRFRHGATGRRLDDPHDLVEPNHGERALDSALRSDQDQLVTVCLHTGVQPREEAEHRGVDERRLGEIDGDVAGRRGRDPALTSSSSWWLVRSTSPRTTMRMPSG